MLQRLTQVYRQIRHESQPILMLKTEIRIGFEQIERYIKAFFPPLITHASVRIGNIAIDSIPPRAFLVELDAKVDLLSLINM